MIFFVLEFNLTTLSSFFQPTNTSLYCKCKVSITSDRSFININERKKEASVLYRRSLQIFQSLSVMEPVQSDQKILDNSTNDDSHPPVLSKPDQSDQKILDNSTNDDSHPPVLSKNAQKKLLKQQRFEANKARKKAAIKEQKQKKAEEKRREWDEKLAGLSEDEKAKLIESRIELRRERMEKVLEERGKKIERLTRAKEEGQKIIIDLEFSDLMTPTEIHSLVQQIMYCYAVNGKSSLPGHLWLTGCRGEIETQLQRLPGFDKWTIEKESRSYVEALQDQKDNLVYLTADSETVLDELDSNKIYIIGGLVDRNRWKGLTRKKAEEQGIQTAKLPIGNYLKMLSSQVLTVNQVVEILLKFLETRDWKMAFFQVIPQRKRNESEAEVEEGNGEEDDSGERKKKCIEQSSIEDGNLSP